MSITELAQIFIDAHKPSRIDVDYIIATFGSIELFLESESQLADDCVTRYVEVDSFDSKTGNPIIIEWDEED